MRRLSIPALLMILAAFVVSAAAQQTDPSGTNSAEQTPPAKRADLLKQLGLSDDQLRAIRQANRERRPVLEAAQQKFRAAMLALDASIYADNFDEQTYQARLKEMQRAQADLQRVRFANELNIRRLLTPQQLITFRDLRLRYNNARQKAGDPQNKPAVRRLQNRRRRQQPTNVPVGPLKRS